MTHPGPSSQGSQIGKHSCQLRKFGFHPLSPSLPSTCGLVPPKDMIMRPIQWRCLFRVRSRVRPAADALQLSFRELAILARFLKWFAIRHLDVNATYIRQHPETIEYYKREVLSWGPLSRFLLQYEEAWALEVVTRKLFLRKHELVRLTDILLFRESKECIKKTTLRSTPITSISTSNIHHILQPRTREAREHTPGFFQPQVDAEPLQEPPHVVIPHCDISPEVPYTPVVVIPPRTEPSLPVFLKSLRPNMDHALQHLRCAGIHDAAFHDLLNWNPYRRAIFVRRELEAKISAYDVEVIVSGMDDHDHVLNLFNL